MAWSFTNLKYGWRYVVGISLAATTIYVANNTRWRINQADDIELDLAVAERCLATQYGTNAAGEPLYRVVPPEYVRSWYSNSYVTTNVPGDAVTNWTAQLHTNIYTNTVGWRTDRAKAVSRDAKIKALCPYYVDTDSVYDGTTNIIMHTFTGLLTSLDLGDHTNFTAIPAIGATPATYGPWAWRNYLVAWEERYKMLNALKMTYVPSYFQGRYKGGTYAGTGTWAYAKTKAEENFNDDPFEGDIGGNNFTISSVGGKDIIGWEYLAQFQISSVTQMFLVAAGTYVPASLTTNIAHKTTYFGKFAASGIFDFFGYFSGLIETPDYYQIIAEEASWGFKENSIIENLLVPDWGDIPTWCDEPMVSGSFSNRGFNLWGYNYKRTFPVIDWQFNYATNKYW